MSDSGSPIVWDSALVLQLQYDLFDTAVTCLSYGCFLIIAIIAICMLIRRGLSSTRQRWLLATVLVFLVSLTVSCAAGIALDLDDLTLGPYDDNQSELDEQLSIVITIFCRIIYLLNDILVVWRAWVIADRPILRLILACSMLITIGSVITEATITILSIIKFQFVPLAAELFLYVPLIFNNLLATSVVLYKTWIYRTYIKTHLQQVSSKNQVERVLFLLIESGFIYCGWWILVIVATYVQSLPITIGAFTEALSPFASATYPVLIILVVEYQKSQAEQASAKFCSHSLPFNPPPRSSSKQTGSMENHSVSIIQSIADIQSARRRPTRMTSIIQAILNRQSARREKTEGGTVENKTSHALSDNDFDAVA